MTQKGKMRLKRSAVRLVLSVLRLLFIAGICFVILYPLITELSTSVMSVQDVYDGTVKYVPKHFTLSHYTEAMRLLKYGSAMLNTIPMAIVISAVQMISSTFVAYGFARFNFKGNNILFLAAILAMMIPPDVLLVPYYLQFRSLSLLNTWWPMIILGLTCTGLKNGLYIFIMRQYFKGVPRALEEAAYIDGAGVFRTLVSIILPDARSMMVTVFLFSFVWTWLDGMYIPVFCSNLDVLPTTIGALENPFANLANAGNTQILAGGLIQNAGIVLVIAPLLVLYVIAQKSFVESVSRSGLVG